MSQVPHSLVARGAVRTDSTCGVRGPAEADPGAGRRRAFATAATFVCAAVGALAVGRPWVRITGRMGPWGNMMDPGPALNPRGVAQLLILAAVLAALTWASGQFPRTAYGAVLLTTTAYLGLGGPLAASLAAPAITLTVVLRRHPQVEWIGWAALLVPMFWARFLPQASLGLGDPETYLTVFFGVAWVMVPSLLLVLLGSRRDAAQSARDDELRKVAYEERLRVARDIHDVVGHSLSLISLQSGVALHVLDTDPGQARASLEAIRDAAKGSLAEVRHTLGVFRQADDHGPLAPTPSLAGLPALIEAVRTGGTAVHLVLTPRSDGVPAAVQTVAYRVVQEGLTNAVRHAPGASVTVTVGRRGADLVVVVLDEGTATTAPVEGLGLRGMRERVEAIGGRLSVLARPGGGVAVEAVLPGGGDSA